MIHDALITVLALVVIAVIWIIAVAAMHREAPGHGRHATRPATRMDADDPAPWADEDPDVGTMTFTGPMPKITGDTYDLPGWEPLRPLPVQTVNLPPWALEEEMPDAQVRGLNHQESDDHGGDARPEVRSPGGAGLDEGRFHHGRGVLDRSEGEDQLTDLPGPVPGATGVISRAGKLRNTWTGLLGRPDPQNLPAQGPEGARDTGQSPLGGEPVIEGVVVSHVLADTWLQDQLEQLRAWSDSHCQQLAAWSQLEVAA